MEKSEKSKEKSREKRNRDESSSSYEKVAAKAVAHAKAARGRRQGLPTGDQFSNYADKHGASFALDGDNGSSMLSVSSH